MAAQLRNRRNLATLDEAIACHKAAQATVASFPESKDMDEERANEPALTVLVDAEMKAFDALAELPCADDAELLRKLRYLTAHEIHSWGQPRTALQYGGLALALAAHFSLPA